MIINVRTIDKADSGFGLEITQRHGMMQNWYDWKRISIVQIFT